MCKDCHYLNLIKQKNFYWGIYKSLRLPCVQSLLIRHTKKQAGRFKSYILLSASLPPFSHLKRSAYIPASTTASANASRSAIFSSFSVDLIVTTGSTIDIFFIVSRTAFIVLAAVGAQEPFSKMPTVRF